MPLLANGSFGCVYSPSLYCDTPPTTNFSYENKISKIGKKETIEEEWRKYRFIELADKDSKYYLGKPIKCKPNPNTRHLEVLNKIRTNYCPFFDEAKFINTNDYSLLILDNGGVTLKDFVYDVNSYTGVY